MDAQHHTKGQAMLYQEVQQGARQYTALMIAESDLDATMQQADSAGLAGAIRALVAALGSSGDSHTAAVEQVSSAVLCKRSSRFRKDGHPCALVVPTHGHPAGDILRPSRPVSKLSARLFEGFFETFRMTERTAQSA